MYRALCIISMFLVLRVTGGGCIRYDLFGIGLSMTLDDHREDLFVGHQLNTIL